MSGFIGTARAALLSAAVAGAEESIDVGLECG